MGRRLLVFLLLVVATAWFGGCSSPDRKLASARRLEREGKTAEALSLYRAILPGIHDPRARSQVLLRMGDGLYRLDRPAEAFAAFEKAVEADNSNLAAQLRLGDLYLSAGAPEQAQQQAEAMLRVADGNT